MSDDWLLSHSEEDFIINAYIDETEKDLGNDCVLVASLISPSG
jgi:hypothetical protein